MCTGYEPRRRNLAKENRESISPARVRSSQKWRGLSVLACVQDPYGEAANFSIFIWLSSIHDSTVSCPGILLRDSTGNVGASQLDNNRPDPLRKSNKRDSDGLREREREVVYVIRGNFSTIGSDQMIGAIEYFRNDFSCENRIIINNENINKLYMIIC